VAQQGRTVLFVSHNLPAVIRLCPRSIWLDRGKIELDSNSEQVTAAYTNAFSQAVDHVELPPSPESPMRLRGITILDRNNKPTTRIEASEPCRIQVNYDINRDVVGAHVICFIQTSEGVSLLGTGDADCLPDQLGRREPGTYLGEFEIPPSLLGEGQYFITVSMGVPFVQVYDRHEMILGFEIFDNQSSQRQWQHMHRQSILGLELPWIVSKIN